MKHLIAAIALGVLGLSIMVFSVIWFVHNITEIIYR
jgi:hypothetical protein